MWTEFISTICSLQLHLLSFGSLGKSLEDHLLHKPINKREPLNHLLALYQHPQHLSVLLNMNKFRHYFDWTIKPTSRHSASIIFLQNEIQWTLVKFQKKYFFIKAKKVSFMLLLTYWDSNNFFEYP